MATAFPGQLGPVRLLGQQRCRSVRIWRPPGEGGFASLGIPWRSVSSLLCSYPIWWGEVKTDQQFCWSAFPSVPFQLFPLCVSTCAHNVRSHQTHTHVYRHSHTNGLTQTRAYVLTLPCTYSLEYAHPCTLEHTLTHAFCLSLSHAHPLS